METKPRSLSCSRSPHTPPHTLSLEEGLPGGRVRAADPAGLRGSCGRLPLLGHQPVGPTWAEEPGVAGGQVPECLGGPRPAHSRWGCGQGRGARPTAARPSGGILHSCPSSEEGRGFPSCCQDPVVLPPLSSPEQGTRGERAQAPSRPRGAGTEGYTREARRKDRG